MEQLLTFLYGASGITAAALYLPQIRAYHRDRASRASISLLTWGGWIVIALITASYAAWVIDNPLIAGIALLNVVAQVAVLGYGLSTRLALPSWVRLGAAGKN